MRIAIETTAAWRKMRTGIARYTIDLTEALLAGAAAHGDTLALGCRLSRRRRREFAYRPAGVRSFWIQEPWWPLRKPFDVVHGTDARVPHWRGVARVATLHDVFSLLFEQFADARFREKKRAAYETLARQCDRIIAVSAATKADFLRFIDFPDDRIDVVHHGVDPAFVPQTPEAIERVRKRFGLERPYALFVGELSTRKNIPNPVEGFR
ncbi:MAG: glycosyltransferase, partial [Planctomycetota bacterium]